jgi:putative addiction module killer protein
VHSSTVTVIQRITPQVMARRELTKLHIAYVAYTLHLSQVKRLDEFSDWLKALRDLRARAKITQRIDRLELGNPGDVAPVGEGVSEMRIHYGPGYRVYITQRGEELVVLLCGGDKSTQAADINLAKKLASELED